MRYIFLICQRPVITGILLIFIAFAPGRAAGEAATALPPGPAWANPTAVSVRSLGTSPTTGEGRLAFEDNLNCLKQAYTLQGTDQSQTGCYVSTAFGGVDIENGLISFAGNEKTAIPLVPFGPHEVLLPWPGTDSMLAINPSSNDGAYLSIYRNILGATQDQHNILGQVSAKQVVRPADAPLLNVDGRKLIVNFNSLTFSDGGAWLVAESMSGSFVRINLATLQAKPFAPSFVNIGAGYNQSQVAISADGDYVAIANSAASSIRVYDLVNCPGPVSEATICPSHDYWTAVKGKAADLVHPVHVRFLHDGLLSFTNIVNSKQTTYELAPAAGGFAVLDYLALGDSYASGEGARAYLNGTDSEANNCHTSSKAYPALLTADLYHGGGHSVACSGAALRDLLPSPRYDGQTADKIAFGKRSAANIQQILANFLPGSLPQMSFMSHYQPAAATVSVGGNDVGFGNILQLCIAPHVSPHFTNANACYETYEDRLELAHTIDAQESPMTKLYKRLQAASPATTIYAVGYPLIAVDNGNCALNVHLSTSELALSIEITKQINNVISRAARAAGVNYVNIESALAGHRLCEVSSNLVAVNGLTAGDDGGITATLAAHALTLNFLGSESYHPNAYGYQLIEQAILKQTHNLQLKLPPPAPGLTASDPQSGLLKAPKSGRPVINKQPATITPHKSPRRGANLPIKLHGPDHGLRAGNQYTVKLRQGSAVSAIGVIQSNSSGDLDGSVLLPPTSPAGTSEIQVSGTDQLGNPVTMIDVITIVTSETDYDGDGIPNATDSCPTITNSAVDADHDGIDDACDSSIGTAVLTTPLPTPAPLLPLPPTTNNSQLEVPSASVVSSPELVVLKTNDTKLEPSLITTRVGQATAIGQISAPPPRAVKLVGRAETGSQASVLGVNATKLIPFEASASPKTSSPPMANFTKLRRLPWLWVVGLYAVTIILYNVSGWVRRSNKKEPSAS